MFIIKDYCDNNYCRNGGTCYSIENAEFCVCVLGITGDYCELST